MIHADEAYSVELDTEYQQRQQCARGAAVGRPPDKIVKRMNEALVQDTYTR